MFRSMSSEGHMSSGQSSSSPTGHGVASSGLDSQESTWISLLSVVSRPAMSFLQKYLPGRPRNLALPDKGAGWMSGELKTSFVEEETAFLRQLDDMMPQHPAPHLTYLQCQHQGSQGGGSLPWMTPESLQEIGIQGTEELEFNLCQQTQIGYVSSIRTLLSLSSVSSQEIKPSLGKDWGMETVSSSVKNGRGKSRTWWDSFWGGEDCLQKDLFSDLPWVKERMVTDQHCPKQPEADIKAPAAGTTAVFVQSDIRGETQGENTGPTDHKDQPANNGGLHTVENTETSTPDQHLSTCNHLSRSGAATACSEVAVLTPDQDQGYSSLEEEHFHMCHQPEVKVLCEGPPQPEPKSAIKTVMEQEVSGEEESASGKSAEEEGMKNDEENQEEAAEEDPSAEVVLTNPKCQNKAIAFIMGCPCSDDDSSQSEEEGSSDEDDDDDDDDGFDSEGSSDLSDSSDEEDEEDSDSEADSEAERLWTSLSQNSDPYNPRNFTAHLQTRSTPPRTIPTSTPPSSAQSTPASSPDTTLLPVSSLAALPPLASSPPSGSDSWDDSASASEVDEAESLRLWGSFSSSADPYSPFNFQASIRTRGPVEAGPRTRARAKKTSKTLCCSSQQNPTSPPEYRKEEAEDRLDSGFSEPCASSSSSRKKVRFCDEVEEFFASCSEEEEDRRGPWEELARDRCRFVRRCQEVEQSIAFCLQPQHRSLVFQRLAVLYVQDA